MNMSLWAKKALSLLMFPEHSAASQVLLIWVWIWNQSRRGNEAGCLWENRGENMSENTKNDQFSSAGKKKITSFLPMPISH